MSQSPDPLPSSLSPDLTLMALDEDLRVVRQQINALIEKERSILAEIKKLEEMGC